MPPFYTYDYSLSDTLSSIITDVVAGFAAEHALRHDIWYHDLPVWLIRTRIGSRVNRVQIDAVVTSGRSLLSFTPDAYKDMVERVDGMERVQRHTASASLLRRVSLDLDTAELSLDAAAHPEGPGGERAARRISDALANVWERAQELPLDAARTWYRGTSPLVRQ